VTLTEKRLKRLAALTDLGASPRWWQWRRMLVWRRRYVAIMTMDLSEAAELMRDIYTPQHIEDLARRSNTVLAFLTKKPNQETR